MPFGRSVKGESSAIVMINEQCPICGSNLWLRRYDEYRGEYWGQPCYETMREKICIKCGKEVD